MSTFITLVRLRDKGRTSIGEIASRLESAKNFYATHGVQLKAMYRTLSEYDFIIVCEAANNEAVARLTDEIDSHGTSTSETLIAFNEDECKTRLFAKKS